MMMLKNKNGQNAIEYMLLFVAVVLLMLAAIRPNGFVTRAMQQSLNTSLTGVDEMTKKVYYNVYAEPGTYVEP